MLKVTLLGTGGMMPLKERALASLILSWNGHSALIDCGEGTQVQIRSAGLSFKSIDLLLLTHYHADHVSGLPGLLLSIGNQGRTEPLTVAGPPGLERVINGLRVIAPELPYELIYMPLDAKDPAEFAFEGLTVTPFPLRHNIPCLGYKFYLPRCGKFDMARAKANGVPLPCWSVLQKSPEAVFEGRTYTQDMVLGPARRGLTVVYATDTRPTPVISDMAQDADLLVAEAMYGDPEKLASAKEKGHMLMTEASELARVAKPRRCWLTHYSPAMPDPESWIPLAQAIYPAIELGQDGMAVDLAYTNEGPAR